MANWLGKNMCYFAFGVNAKRQAVLVRCQSRDDAELEKERLKQSDCVRVSFTSKPVHEANMLAAAHREYSELTVRDFSQKVSAIS